MPCDAVELTPLSLADADAHLAGEDDELAHWLSGGRSTTVSVAQYLQRCVDQWAAGGPVHAFGIRVGSGASVQLAGTIEVQFDQAYLAPGQANIAYGIYPAWRNRGIATSAVLAACRHAASHGVTTAVIRVDQRNAPSAAVARRAGFIRRGNVVESTGANLDWYTRALHP